MDSSASIALYRPTTASTALRYAVSPGYAQNLHVKPAAGDVEKGPAVDRAQVNPCGCSVELRGQRRHRLARQAKGARKVVARSAGDDVKRRVLPGQRANDLAERSVSAHAYDVRCARRQGKLRLPALIP